MLVVSIDIDSTIYICLWLCPIKQGGSSLTIDGTTGLLTARVVAVNRVSATLEAKGYTGYLSASCENYWFSYQ